MASKKRTLSSDNTSDNNNNTKKPKDIVSQFDDKTVTIEDVIEYCRTHPGVGHCQGIVLPAITQPILQDGTSLLNLLRVRRVQKLPYGTLQALCISAGLDIKLADQDKSTLCKFFTTRMEPLHRYLKVLQSLPIFPRGLGAIVNDYDRESLKLVDELQNGMDCTKPELTTEELRKLKLVRDILRPKPGSREDIDSDATEDDDETDWDEENKKRFKKEFKRAARRFLGSNGSQHENNLVTCIQNLISSQ